MHNKLSYEVSHVMVTPQLLSLLRQKPKGRYTRLDAYFDLLGRAMAKKPFSVLPKSASAELLCHFDTTVTELAERWGWQRATVREFLSELSAIGQLERKDEYKNTVITFDALKFKWNEVDVAENDTAGKAVKDADAASASNEPPAEGISVFTSIDRQIHSGKQSDRNEPKMLADENETAVVCSQRRLCRQLYDDLFSGMSDLIKEMAYTPKVEHALYRAYYNICGGDGELWQKYIRQADSNMDLCLTVYGTNAVQSSADAIEKYFIRFGQDFLVSDAQPQKTD